jgi:beta-mannosidase
MNGFERISLNGGDWQFKGYLGEDWAARRAFHPDSRDRLHWRPGQVPGSVLHDLWACGEVPDPYFERNSLLLEWVPERAWVYRKTFTLGCEHRGRRIRLNLQGVDYAAQVYLNGEFLGSHTGMFSPALYEVADLLRWEGENLLAVVIEPAPREQPQVGRTSLVQTHKTRMNYWWDFCPRMVHQGIWQDVLLEVTGPVRIEDAFIRPQLSEDLKRATLPVEVSLSSTASARVEVAVSLFSDGRQIDSRNSTVQVEPGTDSLAFDFEIEAPRLWWPNGYGEQPLYEAVFRVSEPGASQVGRLSDQRSVIFGIRKVEFVRNERAHPDARPYTLRVNGQVIYINGWNWVPMDMLYGVDRPEKLERLVTLAARAHVNMLRVWGGGLIEKESFYSLCDRAGILIWQEFIQSSSGIDNEPSRSQEFVERMAAEAEQIILAKRNHPSLAVWCGGNELQSPPGRPLDDDHPVLSALKSAVERLDPDRYWLPTSPSGPHFSFSLANASEDPEGCHDLHGPWEHQGLNRHQRLYNQGISLLHSEFGVEGITNLRTLDATISLEHQWPFSLENPVWQHLGAWWLKESAWRQAFGEIRDIKTAVQAVQFLQADGLRYAVEADRRRQFKNSGSLPWQFNEPYPMAACTSAVDYYAEPKTAYYAVAGAYEPLLLSASFEKQAWEGEQVFESQVWVSNPTGREFREALLKVRIVAASGICYHQETRTVRIAGTGTIPLRQVRVPLPPSKEPVFFLDLSLSEPDGSFLGHNRYVFSSTEDLAPMLAVPETSLEVVPSEDGDSWEVSLANTGSWAALFIRLEGDRSVQAGGYAYFDRNHFCLFPGENQAVFVKWAGIPPEERRLAVAGWNTPVYKAALGHQSEK